MTGVSEGFEYKEGVWTAVLLTPKKQRLKVLVIGDIEFMNSSSVPVQLRTFMNSLDERIDIAAAFAWHSEYKDDISLAGGVNVDSVVVNKWDDAKFWFTLRGSDRMVGVRMHEDKAVGVFCDH